ncbi:WGxxGxxG family protein [Methylorubrum extorquens]|uniref:WGxxGxxG family protein n=1 Tax=Methylorubrum extorquens TaxID=408 RepID=UPI0011BF102F|nr:WGxxGxxG family protein [Methylorubrum extorquens]
MRLLPASLLALALVASPALAQQTTTSPTTTQQTAPRADKDNNDFDLGWLGLIGLLGLGGLLGRRRHDHVATTSTTPGATVRR